jgi:murein L,D-transpeptidase YcbB/YkuD
MCFSLAHADDFVSIKAATLNLNNTNIESVYKQRKGQYLWVSQGMLTSHAYDALEFIQGSQAHGLSPQDYHLELLKHLRTLASPDQIQQFEILLTDGLLKLIQDMATGKHAPQDVDPEWQIQRAEIDAVEFLLQAQFGKNLKQQLDTLKPNLAEYQLLTSAYARYKSIVTKGGWTTIPETPLLRPGDKHKHIPYFRQRLAVYNSALTQTASVENLYDEDLALAVKRFQHNHAIKVDGIIGSETLSAMNVPAEDRLRQIMLNLDRFRWLPRNLGEQYVLINIPNYQLRAVNQGKTELEMRVIVGKEKRRTPSFATQMSHIVFHPYWNVPRKIARIDLLTKQQKNPDYFYMQNIRVYQRNQTGKDEIDPYFVDWEQLSPSDFPYSLRQDPGPNNALGQVKFMIPNPWDIYLHDTPDKTLFADSKRNYSSGCVRLEDPVALAEFTLANSDLQKTTEEYLAKNENQWYRLNKNIHVYTTYFTVWSADKQLIFAPDSYKRDLNLAKYL